jgi:hypothetical protein
MKKIALEVRKSIILLIIGSLIGWGLLIIAYTLPVDKIKLNVSQAYDEISEWGPSPELIEGRQSTRLDIYSDSVMLNEAVYDGDENVVEKSLASYEYMYDGKTSYESFLICLEGETGAVGTEYARYWHGYLIFLKPLLMIFKYGDIKLINFIAQVLLVGGIIIEMERRNIKGNIYGLLLCIISMMPFAISLCLEYSIIFNIMLVFGIILVKYYEQIKEKQFIYQYYLIVGICTCYFDLFTYPLVTLGFLLLLDILLDRKNESSIRDSIVSMLNKAFFWAFGYVGIWGIKWILASIVMKENIIKEAVLFVLYRSSSATSDSGIIEYISRGQALNLNIKTILIPSVIGMIIISLCLAMIKMAINKKISVDINYIILNSVVAIMPFIWILFTANHAYVHNWMVYREFSTTVFAVTNILISFIERKNIESTEKNNNHVLKYVKKQGE